MEILIIDSLDNKGFSETLFTSLNEVDIIHCTLHKSDKKPSEISEEIIKKYPNNICKEKENKEDPFLLFINIEGKFGRANRQELKGIEILKWLRLKNITNHCIMFSFLSLTKIVKMNPANSILLSKGVTFLRAPFTLSDLTDKKYKEKLERENLLHFFRGEIDLKKIRHELANIWGLYRLKWAFDSQEEETTKNNYLIQILKYLNFDEKTYFVNRNNIDSYKTYFNKTNPEIIYYDDMADSWGPYLIKIFGSKFKAINPASFSTDQLIELIKKKPNPKCLLLDLRLKNEKYTESNPLKYSGGELLIKLKEICFSLPIIMFTATNKAESVRKLIAAGADYVWTKEGVDDGINDFYTIKSTEDLLYNVKKSVLKFKNPIYEKIYETESKINTTYKGDKKTENILTTKLENFKVIVIDTNFLLDTEDPVNTLNKFHKLLLSNCSLGNKKKEILIHEDVYREVFILSKQDERVDKNKETVPIANLLLRLIYKWQYENLISIPYKDGQSSAINQISEINKDFIPLEKINFEQKTFFDKIIGIFENKIEEEIKSVNEKIENFNNKVNNVEFKKIILHADDTFNEIIPKYLKNKSVIFVTTDNTCAYNVGECLKKELKFLGETKIRVYNCKFDRETEVKTPKIGIEETLYDKHFYRHFYNKDFLDLL